VRALIAAAALFLALGAAEAATFQVVNVRRGDTLKLRAAPDQRAAAVGDLPPNSAGIAVVAVDTKGSDWVKVSKGRLNGWVNARFLGYDNGMPARLSCLGTEPFWGIEIGPGNVAMDFRAMDESKPQRAAFADPVLSRGHGWPWMLRLSGGDFLIVDKRECSDDMSDRRYSYSVIASVRGRFVDGCCK
jgi:uncharacterized membrane protein